MYKYETHLHTHPVSKCASADVRNNMQFYKALGYDGIFITNHFLDGNVNISEALSYEERINFYCSDYELAEKIAPEIGIKVFFGVEMSYKGTDFLVYGLDKNWFLAHPEIMDMYKTKQLSFMMEEGALVIQAHPFREASYINHIRLFPRSVHGVEVINANRLPFENNMAKIYASSYGLTEFAGTDNHIGDRQQKLAGMCSDIAVTCEADFVLQVKSGKMGTFSEDLSRQGD